MVTGIVLPFLLLFMSSITEENTLIQNGYAFWPDKFSLAAYSYIWNQRGQIFRAYGITIFVTVVGTITAVLLSAMTGYVLARPDFP